MDLFSVALNDILGLNGEKNRNDHRHHAVDACVIAVTDQSMLQKFAKASASAREKQLNKLVETMPLPWNSYREHVQRAVSHIWVSHKPDHGHEGAMHNDTAYGLLGAGHVQVRKRVDGVRNEKGKWEGEVVSTFEAYQLVRQHGLARLRHPALSVSGRPLVMRLLRNDILRLIHNGEQRTVRICKMTAEGVIALADTTESNVDARTRTKDLSYIFKTAGSLQKSNGRRVAISPSGEMKDSGFLD